MKEVIVPDIGISSAEVTEILVCVGEIVKKEQPIILVESDKTAIEIPSPFSGVITDIKVSVGDIVNEGLLIMLIKDSCDNSSSCNINNNDISDDISSNSSKDVFNNDSVEKNNAEMFFVSSDISHATPSVRRLARELNVNLVNISGSGRKGRILKEDVIKYFEDNIKSSKDVSYGNIFSNISSLPREDFSKFGNIEEVDIRKVQKISGSNLHRNWIMVPHITQFDEIDITDLECFRKNRNIEEKNKNSNLKITILSFIIKVISKCLEKLPYFNSSLSLDNKRLILKKYINIGVAVNTTYGLLVPVLRDVNKKGIIEISYELIDLINKARCGKLTASDMNGGSFTVSNVGGLGGGTFFTTIVNVPEVAILGVSRASIKPIWDGEKFVPKLILPVSLTYDHRVIDGADGVKFISYINMFMSDVRHLIM
ncbi:MAG: pyruvate dehydrogenase, E2 subunit [Candidatus Westeberhardia cardiocondylae]|nr:pyruvate dehydrogenase, E2 subunit [Candidatus Westeberhardia cardiocondylae]